MDGTDRKVGHEGGKQEGREIGQNEGRKEGEKEDLREGRKKKDKGRTQAGNQGWKDTKKHIRKEET